MSRKTSLIGCLVGLVLVAGTARGDLIIDTGWDGTVISALSAVPGATHTFGQTFTVTESDLLLDSFSFWWDSSDVLMYVKGYIAEWNGVESKTGTLKWSSDETSIAGGAAQSVGFTGLNLAMNEGQQYVAFLSTLESTDSPGYAEFRALSTDEYDGGSFFYSNATTFSSLLTDAWVVGDFLAADLSFTANLKNPPAPAIPEPSSFAVFGLSCLGMAFVRSRRSRRRC